APAYTAVSKMTILNSCYRTPHRNCLIRGIYQNWSTHRDSQSSLSFYGVFLWPLLWFRHSSNPSFRFCFQKLFLYYPPWFLSSFWKLRKNRLLHKASRWSHRKTGCRRSWFFHIVTTVRFCPAMCFGKNRNQQQSIHCPAKAQHGVMHWP